MSNEDSVREFQSPLTLDACQERLLACFDQPGSRVSGWVAWHEFEARRTPRFGLGATPIMTGEIRPVSEGSLIMVRLGAIRTAGVARAVLVVLAVLWLLWLGTFALWLAGAADAGIGPGRLLALLAVNLGMGVTYLAGRRLDREDPEDLLWLVRDALDVDAQLL